MQTSEMTGWILAALAGAALGFVFFRALLATVERLVTSTRPGRSPYKPMACMNLTSGIRML